MRSAVFFDLDGTLTDPFLGITRCIAFAMESMGDVPPQPAELGWCIGPPLRDSLAILVGDARADQALTLYRERFAEIGLFENTPYDGIVDVLTEVEESGSRLFVASSKPLVFVRQITERFGLSRFFEDQFGAELDGRLTDKGQLLAHALEHTGAAVEASVMVGDRRHDVIGAKANGMPCIGAAYGYGGATELEQAGAVSLAHRAAELPKLIKSAHGRF